MKPKDSKSKRTLDQITVGDIVRFLLWLPDDDRQQATEVLRAVQDRHWREVWYARIVAGLGECYTRVGEICRRYGLLLIADEVTTGFGRTGKLIATQD